MPVVISEFEVTAPVGGDTPPTTPSTSAQASPPPSHNSLEQSLRAETDRAERVRAH